jgi:DNA-binding transcriptional MerR regulator/mannose-6-phosphate isomerase-like protein (cupin superfamily)
MMSEVRGHGSGKEPVVAYTVKQVAAISGVSVRTLHFYDETGLLKPAHQGTNGYRYYQEPQLLRLQQILFYRELGFELKQIKNVLDRPEFENVSALQAHREVLEENLSRTRALLETIDSTLKHLKGDVEMRSEEMFKGFAVAAGKGRFDENIQLGGEPNDCKVSSRDTHGAMSAFEFTGSSCGPRHLHHEQDEWIYVVDGELEIELDGARRHLATGESVFIPRKLKHVWASAGDNPAKIIDVYQPAGKIEDFFRKLGSYGPEEPIHEVLTIDQFRRLFEEHGMDLAGPPLTGEWKVSDDGRIVRIS